MTPKWIEPVELGEPSIKAYVTGRGEAGSSPYSSFNLCHYTGDSEGHIESSCKTLARYLGVAVENIIVPRQTHSSRCVVVERLPVPQSEIEGVDAVVTKLKDTVIGVSTADCVPVVLADPVAGIIGVAHAGWRGAVGGVVENAVSAMVALGAEPSHMKAVIGPCICAGCFEVGDEVAVRFPQSCIVGGYVKPHVDLPRYVTEVLEGLGLRKENLSMHGGCTRCDSDRYFSARRLGINSGRNFTCVMLK